MPAFIENTDNVEQTTGEAVLDLQKPQHFELYDRNENPNGYVLLTTSQSFNDAGALQTLVKLHTNMKLNIAARFILAVFNKLVRDLSIEGIEV